MEEVTHTEMHRSEPGSTGEKSLPGEGRGRAQALWQEGKWPWRPSEKDPAGERRERWGVVA